MKYHSKNMLSDFEFHDAYFKLESFENNTLVVIVQHLNIHKSANQNQNSTDMEIERAKITFDKFCVKSFEPGRVWKQNENGTLYTDEPQLIYHGRTAEEKLFSEFSSGTTVLEFGVLENENYYLDGIGIEPWFQTQFIFDFVNIEWDDYKKPAWYEEKTIKW